MIETETHNLKAKKVVNKINESSDKFTAKLRGIWTKNMSLYCETILIKRDKYKLDIDYWESGFFEIRLPEDYELKEVEIDMISWFEKVVNDEVQIRRYNNA